MPSINEILETELTPLQYAAAIDPSREVRTLACAGSGKSRTLAFRIASLIANGAEPSSIVAFTFTEKAAEAIKLRASDALEKVDLDPTILGAMYIGTIHSYCQSVLREMNAIYRQFDVLDPNRLKLFLISRYPQLGIQQLRNRATGNSYYQTIKKVSDAWNTMNDEMVEIEDVLSEDPVLGQVLSNLRDGLNENQFIDFSLMIRLVVEALRQNDADVLRAISTLRHLMVDEYQDINPSQEALIRELHRFSETLFVVGDDDQAIYAWRGADVSNILTFTDRYPNASEHTVSHNFRSIPSIVVTADDLAQRELGPTRITKNPTADEQREPFDYRVLWFEEREDEAQWVADRIQTLLGIAYRERDGTTRGLTPADFAILMRSTRTPERNARPRHEPFTRALEIRGIPFSLEQGGGIFERSQVRVLIAAMELLGTASPSRETAEQFFDAFVLPGYPNANFNEFANVLRDWGRLIHAPITGPRRRIYPQRLVHDILRAFGLGRTNFDPGVMQDLGVYSRIMQDIETVYLSIDSTQRFQEILGFLRNVAETGYDTGTSEIQSRPDTVTISTVHRAKGLEFPVVFIVDVENGRFPGGNRGYEGWLPAGIIQNAINRGAYQNTRSEEARLFYTALTRAERFVYVSGSEHLPGGVKRWVRSPFSLYLQHPEIDDDPSGLPSGLTKETPQRRIEETWVPTSFSDIRYYLACPRDYQFRRIYGFSPPIPEMFGFGVTVHSAVSRVHQEYPDSVPTSDDAESIARGTFHLKHVPKSDDPVNRPGAYERARDRAAEIVKSYVEKYIDDFAHQRQVEVRFEVPVAQAVLSGSIDLIVKEDENGKIVDACVVEFKTMAGGPDPQQNVALDWTNLALQVQLYCKAANEVLLQTTGTGAIHLLRDNQRVEIPVDENAIRAAVTNIEWAVSCIIAGEFPMRPHPSKCNHCDFGALCPKETESFTNTMVPPPIHIPGGEKLARCFGECQQ